VRQRFAEKTKLSSNEPVKDLKVDQKQEKIHNIREELSSALNSWIDEDQKPESKQKKQESEVKVPKNPRKKKLLKSIQAQLETLSL
jgi:hypothetical protein